jgi:hypothetical protein
LLRAADAADCGAAWIGAVVVPDAEAAAVRRKEQ